MAKYCVNCGEKINESDSFCPKCGGVQDNTKRTQVYVDPNSKSKIGAGLLAIFLGSLGIHNFYLGYTGKAVAQLLLTVVGWLVCGIGPVVAAIWAFIEGVEILAGAISVDANGVPLRD